MSTLYAREESVTKMEREEDASTRPLPSLQKQEQKADERGGGGKTRRQFDRKPPLPYARVQPQQDKEDNGGGGWWHSASRIFSFFSKRSSDSSAPANGSEEVTNNASEEGHATFHDAQTKRAMEDGQGPLLEKVTNSADMHGGDTSRRPFESIGISEIEHMFEGKTLSRDEFSRFKEILQSRITVEPDAEETGKRNLDATKGVVASSSQETPKEPGDDTEDVFLNRVIGESSNLFPRSTSGDLVGASPIDIAKAYMGSRTSEIGAYSKSVVSREKTTPSSARGVLSKSSVLSPRPNSSICWPGSMVQQTHYSLTPQTERGRVGIHSSLRTPYSRPVHSSTIPKWESGRDRSKSILSSTTKHLQTPLSGGQVAWTSNSSFTDGFGSVGPVRRSRRKFRGTTTPSKGMNSSNSATAPLWSESLYARKNFLPMVKQNLEPGTSSGSNSKFQPEDVMAPSSITVSIVRPPVQPQSTDTARDILEHLDRIVATPEKKSAELKLATSWRNLSSSDSTTSKGKAPVNNLLSKNFDTQLSGHVIRQKFIGQEKEVRGTSLQNNLAELKKTDETTNSINTQSLGTRVLSSEITPGHTALQFDADLSKESTRNPQFGVSRDEVFIRQESSQNGKDNPVPQQKEAGVQAFPRFSDNNSSYEAPKKLSAHIFGNKPALTNISVTKSNPSCKSSADNGFNFTFPVSASSGPLFEAPPTPSILPSFSASSLPRPQEHSTVQSNNCGLKGGLSYSFGSKNSREALVFSFSSSPSFPTDSSIPRFTFGSDKGRISFRSFGEDAVCS